MLDKLQESSLYQKFKPWYDSLGSRDQRFLKIGAAVLCVVVLIFGLLFPAIDYRASAEQHYQESLDTLSWMQANRGAVQRTAVANSLRDPGQSLLGIANQTAKGYNISFKRYQPVDDNGLNLWMDNVSFNNVVLWLERLDKRYGIVVKEVAVDRQEQKGVVNIRLMLEG